MELIYTDNNFVEQGIISDFEIDFAYGKDENDFEIKTPERELQQGFYWYIKDTEYGGVIDEIEYQSSIEEGLYKGRSWSGILNSFSGIQIATSSSPRIEQEGVDKDIYFNISGSPKAILNYILVQQLGLNVSIMDESYDDEITVKVNAVQPLYNMLLEMFNPFNIKLVFAFEGNLKVGALSANDYTQNQYFDTSQVNLTANSTVKVPNHLVGIYNNGEKTFVKHIYTDENGVIQPYYELDTTLHSDTPKNDLEYERATGTKKVTGLNEIVEVVQAGSGIERYERVSELKGVDETHPYGTEGNTEFVRGVPYDWNDKVYEKYYEYKYDENSQKFDYKQYELEWEYTPVDTSQISGAVWADTYQNYYKRSAEPDASGKYTYTQLTRDDGSKAPRYTLIDSKPSDWDSIYNTWAYYREYYDGSYHYTNLSAKSVPKYILQTGKNAPTGSQYGWSQHKGEYYLYWRDKRWKVEYQVHTGGKWKTLTTVAPPIKFNSNIEKTNSKGVIYVLNNLAKVEFTQTITKYTKNNTTGTKEPKLKKKNTNLAKELGTQNITSTKYVKVTDTSRFKVHATTTDNSKNGLNFTSVADWCSATNKKLSSVKYKAYTYYRVESISVPPDFDDDYYSYGDKSGLYWNSGEFTPPPQTTYYRQEDVIKPAFDPQFTYMKITDNYTNLCEEMLKKYDEIRSKAQNITPKIDTDIVNFNIGDIVGGVHPITNEEITNKIVKKIVKGNSYKMDVSYEIG